MAKRRTRSSNVLAALLSIVMPGLRAEAAPLAIGKDCVLRLNNRPYRAIGINYFTAFTQVLANPADLHVRTQLRRLHEAGIPFIRFPVLPYWPDDAKPFINDPDRLFAAMDRFVTMAKAEKIGLIPSVFFNSRTIPDVFGEPVAAWTDPSSRSATFMRDFAARLARRYHASTAIWAWELSNETNDWSDLPDAYRHFEVDPRRGTPPARTAADDYSSPQMLATFENFAAMMRVADPGRLVESGYDMPRNNAFHLMLGSAQRDSAAQFVTVLTRDNRPGDLTSIHVYPADLTAAYSARFADRPVDAAGFVQIAAQTARQACKPLFVGEFGVPDAGTAADGGFDAFRRLAAAIVASPAPLAAAWVFDFPYQNDSFNMTFDNQRSARLALIGRLNRVLAPIPENDTPIEKQRQRATSFPDRRQRSPDDLRTADTPIGYVTNMAGQAGGW